MRIEHNSKKLYFFLESTRQILKVSKSNKKSQPFKVGLSPSKNCFICFDESPLKVMKNPFYCILKVLFVLKICKFLSWLFGYVEKRLD